MKFWDVLELIRNEYRYEKAEWIVSAILQILIFTSVLFLFTIVSDMDKICGEYLSPLYPDGYEFLLKGYSENDIPELEKMGFYNVVIDKSGGGYGLKNDLTGIWVNKFKATISGKDIWDEELEQILSVIFFCQTTFGAVGVAMMIIMVNNLSNSFAMKLIRRKRYIQMLCQLGCSKRICQSIYYWFFGIRNILALVFAVSINVCLIHLLNGYIAKRMYLMSGFSKFSIILVAIILIASMFLMWISFQKQWSQIDEKER